MEHYDFVVLQGASEFREKSLIKLAATYHYRKEYAKALEYYTSLEPIAVQPSTFTSAIMGQMRCQYELKDYPAAKKKAIQLLPIEKVPKEDLVEANMVLGNIQLLDNNLRTAKYHFDYVIENSRNGKTAEALYQRAFINYEQDGLDSSRSDVYTIHDDYSAYEFWVVKSFILLSDIYVKEDDLFQAKATLQSIIDNYDKKDDGILDLCKEKLKQIEASENDEPKIELEEE